jgi:hypothetical protein
VAIAGEGKNDFVIADGCGAGDNYRRDIFCHVIFDSKFFP